MVEQFSVFYDFFKNVETEPDVIPFLQARRKDIETMLTDFRLDQDDILTQLVSLDQSETFVTKHGSIGKQILVQYYVITCVCYP